MDALFLETHPDPENAKSDGPNMVPLNKMSFLLKQIRDIHELVSKGIGFSDLHWTGE